MKKLLCFILAISALLMCGCNFKTENWQEISIENLGTLKIPNDWTYFVEDDVMYILNGEKPVMISYSFMGDENISNLYFKDYRHIEYFDDSAVLSNGPIYGTAKYLYNNDTIELYYLYLGFIREENKAIEFVIWDTEISKELLVDIAKTFVQE